MGIQIGSLEYTRSLREWINDALMTLFFFLVALELKRELVPGELRDPRMAALSIVAALGGMLVEPILKSRNDRNCHATTVPKSFCYLLAEFFSRAIPLSDPC